MPSLNPIKSIRNRAQEESHEPAEAEIRERAFAIWEANGRRPGRAAQDWEQARRELIEAAVAKAPAR